MGSSNDTQNPGEEWDEQALADKMASTTVVVKNEKEILDVKTLSQNTQKESNSIQEKLKLEETKAALQAARDGMEREAARLKQEEQEKTGSTVGSARSTSGTSPGGSSRFGAAAANVASSSAGSKWVPPHMRAGGASLTRRPMSGGQKLDTKDETLFPDLNTADKMLQQEKKQETVAYKTLKKTPVGGTWAAARASGALKKPTPDVKEEAPKQESPKQESSPVKAAEPKVAPTDEATTKPAAKPTPTEPAADAAAVPPKTMPVKKKKKKKDLSTFKPLS